MGTLPLFDQLEPSNGLRDRLKQKLNALASQQIYLGASSWKYEGWLGSIYTAARYQSRGRFSKKRFEQECLAEYGEVFPIVCGDFSFYQFPAPEFWKNLFDTAPANLRFAFKVPEDLTCKVFPRHARYGAKAGLANPAFLDTKLFAENFVAPLLPFRHRVAALMFEFGTFPQNAFAGVEEFLAMLDPFLASLAQGFHYGVEIRTEEFLTAPYLQVLARHGVAHIFNAWTRMPELTEQLAIPRVHTAPFTICRALLKQGRPYEQAVNKFSPYERVQEENEGARQAIRELVRHAKERREPAYLFVNNRLEGNAPGTIDAVTD